MGKKQTKQFAKKPGYLGRTVSGLFGHRIPGEAQACTYEAGGIDNNLLPRGGRQEEGGHHQQHRHQAGQDDGAPASYILVYMLIYAIIICSA